MGYVYGYLNNNPEEGYVTCPLTRRTNVRKYKTGKTKNYNERLDTEFSETRAEFTPKPEDIVLFQTDDEDGTKAENRIHLIFYEFYFPLLFHLHHLFQKGQCLLVLV